MTIPWMEVTLVTAIGLASLFASACAPRRLLPGTRTDKTVPQPVEVTSSPHPTVESSPASLPTPSANSTRVPPMDTPFPTPSRRSPTATQTAALLATGSPVPTVPSAIPSPRPTPTEIPSSVTQTGAAAITIVYDNNAHDERLITAWGFSCLVERGDRARGPLRPGLTVSPLYFDPKQRSLPSSVET